MFNWFFRRTPKTIAELRSRDKDAWCRKYFPEYHALFGGYPKSIPVVYGDPDAPGPHVTGQTRPVELAPWEYFDGEDGSIDEYGNRWSVSYDKDGRKLMSKSPASEEDFIAWCDKRNYFRSGEGLDPSVFVDAVDFRGSYWQSNRNLYLRSLSEKGKETPFLTKPNRISCPSGTFFDEAGPSELNPWGVNAFFIPSGTKKPSYISKRWGPDYRPDTSQVPGLSMLVYWDEAIDGPKPSQEEYDKARWKVWL